MLLVLVELSAASLPAPASVQVPRERCRAVSGGAPADRHSIAWSGPLDADERVRLAAWCEAVGAALVIPAPPAGARATMGDDLAIVSWNIHVGGGDVAALVDALRRGQLTEGAPVGDFVLLIQEAFRGGPEVPAVVGPETPSGSTIRETPPSGVRQDIVEVARSLGLSLFYVPSMRNGRAPGIAAEDRGNAILSTRPLSSFAALELPLVRQRRVAIAAAITGVNARGEPWGLRVATAHLETRASAKRLWVFASGPRAGQARAVAGWLERDGPVVLGADLNTWAEGPNEQAYVTLRRVFPETPPATLQPTFGRWLRLDYVFFRLTPAWHGEVRRAASRFGSDHYPLVGWVRR